MSLPTDAQIRYWDKEKQQVGVIPDHRINEYPEKVREEAVIKKHMVAKADEIIQNLKDEVGKTKATKNACKVVSAMYPEQPFSVGSYYRWSKILREEGVVGLMDDRTLKQEQAQGKVPPSVNEEAWRFFLGLYLDQNKPSVAHCWEITKLKAQAEGWGDIPTRRSFQRYVNKFVPRHVLIAYREGKKALKDKAEPYIERNIAGLKSNQVVIGDHHIFDLFVLNEEGNPARPWITAWMDMRSRTIVGYRITFNPNLTTIMESFANVCQDYGIPEHIYIDNGKDYRAYQFAGGRPVKQEGKIEIDEWQATSMLDTLDVKIHFANPYNARAKPIERIFRNFKEHFSRLFPTYRGGYVGEAPERLNEVLKNKDKLITMEEFEDICSRWIKLVYHEQPQNGKGMENQSPLTVWQENIETVRKVSKTELTFLLTKVKGTRVVGRNGVSIDGINYYSSEITQYLGQKVQVRYDTSDISQVYICDLEDRFLCMAHPVEQSPFIGMDEQSFKQSKKEVKKIRDEVKQYEDYILPGKEFDVEDLLDLKAKEKAKRDKEEALQAPNVVEIQRTHIRESLKKLEAANEDRLNNLTEEELDNIHQLFKAKQPPKQDEEELRKQDMQDLKDALEGL
jgi:hypothetical protein